MPRIGICRDRSRPHCPNSATSRRSRPARYCGRKGLIAMIDINKPQVDAVLVGFGWTGAIMGMELTEAGLNVVALERGENRNTYPDFAYPRIADELTYGIRHKLFQNLSRETLTIRHSPGDRAMPYRQLGSFLPGNGVGAVSYTHL